MNFLFEKFHFKALRFGGGGEITISSEVDEIESWFQRERIDAAVGNLGFLKDRFQSKKIMDESYSCLISAHHPRIKKKISFDQFAKEQQVEISQSTRHLHISQVLKKLNQNLKLHLKFLTMPFYRIVLLIAI